MRIDFTVPYHLKPARLEFGASAQGSGAEDITRFTLTATGQATSGAHYSELTNTQDPGNAVTIMFDVVAGDLLLTATAYDSQGNSTSNTNNLRIP